MDNAILATMAALGGDDLFRRDARANPLMQFLPAPVAPIRGRSRVRGLVGVERTERRRLNRGRRPHERATTNPKKIRRAMHAAVRRAQEVA